MMGVFLAFVVAVALAAVYAAFIVLLGRCLNLHGNPPRKPDERM